MTHDAIPPFDVTGLPSRVIMAAGAIDTVDRGLLLNSRPTAAADFVMALPEQAS